MGEPGRIEDLSQDYRDALKSQNLVPLWPSLRAVLPPKVPARHTQATCWPYAQLATGLCAAKIIRLPPGFEYGDGHRIGQIQTALPGPHG